MPILRKRAGQSLSYKSLLFISASDQSNELPELLDIALDGKDQEERTRAEVELKKVAEFLLFMGGEGTRSLTTLAASGIPKRFAEMLWLMHALFDEYDKEDQAPSFYERRNRDARLLTMALIAAKEELRDWYESLIQRVNLAEISPQLQLPPGSPWTNTLYRQHPLPSKADYYFPVESYYAMLFDEREQELLQILVALGATKITIEDVLPNQPVQEEAIEQLVVQIMASEPRVFEFPGKPSGKFERSNYFWLEHEPSWQTLVNNRLQHGCLSASFELSLDFSNVIATLIQGIAELTTQLDSVPSADLETLATQTIRKRRVQVEFAEQEGDGGKDER